MQTIWSEAKEYLRQRGWTQGLYINAEGNVCLAGAVCLAATQGEEPCPHCVSDDTPQWETFNRAFKTFENQVDKTMSSWNDYRSRTLDEVYYILDRLHEWELSL